MKIVVTGGAGFIGSHFVDHLISSMTDVSQVVVLDKLTYAGNMRNLDHALNDRLKFIQGDICDLEVVREAFQDSEIIINFAAESHVDRSILNSKDFVYTNVLGTQNLLEVANEFGVRKFVQISTDEVYGSIDSGTWEEDIALSPSSPYSASKAAADLLALSYGKTYGLNVSITRSSNNYGPRQYPEKLIPLAILKASRNEKIPVYGSGNNVRDWIHVQDNCYGILKVVESGVAGHIYNIGGGNELSNLSLIKEILKIMGKDEDLIQFTTDRKGHDKRYSVSGRKIQEELSFRPAKNFLEGLNETINWYLENENYFEQK